MDDTLHNVVDFLKKNKKIWSLTPEVMSLVKIVPVVAAALQCNVKDEILSPYNHAEQPPKSSYDMHSS